MKSEITAKINTVGKYGRIVSKIMKGISLACAIVLLVCTFIVCVFLPADSLKFDGTAQGRLSYNTEQRAIGFDDIENEHIKFMGAELKIDFVETADQTQENVNNIDISASAEKFTTKQFKAVVALAFSGAVLILVSIYVIFMFVVKLCKALEVCQSPFETDVLTAMKKLGYAFIPFGVVSIIFNGISSALSIIMTLLVVLMFIYIFSYGAELQRESDDTV
ncbi:MAG: hypothetical protein NC205_09490 [Prevotella sp.]|nr:hypothetical protein [Alistipes senegalensis]MCM1358817.1 hypothetical protein [Prevotella sp.]MCM1473805.1 hypothetical protein [Muribaculaceae bacterium]